MTSVPPEAQPPQPPPQAPPPSAPVGNDANQMAMLAHLLGFVGSFVPSLIIWQVKKDIPFVAQEAKEALNFQISVAIAAVGCAIFASLALAVSWHLYFFFWLPRLVWAGNLAFCLIAALKAKEGISYRYPFAIRLIK